MKHTLLLFTLSLLLFKTATGQNFQNPNVPVQYVNIPWIVQDASINTYNIEVYCNENDLNDLGYSTGAIADKLMLRSFTRVYGEGENTIIFRFSGYGNLNGTLSSKAGNDGKTSYFYTYAYTLPMNYEIYAKGKRIAGSEVKLKSKNGTTTIEQFTYTSKYFASSTEAKNFWNTKGKAEARNQIKTNFDSKYQVFLQEVKENIDYQEVKGYTNFGTFKTNKKGNYEDFDAAAENAKAALASLIAGQPRTGLREKLETSMKFWKTKMKSLDPTNKDEDKLFFACANNLANAYYWVDNIDSALYYVSEAEKSKFREGYLAILKREIEERNKKLARLKVAGVDPYTGPSPATREEIQAIEDKAKEERIKREAEIAAKIAAEEKKLAPVIETYDGYIINREDQRVNGKIVWYKANNGDRTDKKYFVAEGTDKETELSPSFVKVCEFASTKYEFVKFVDATGISKGANLLLVAYESDKIKVYKMFTPVKDSDRITTDVFFKRPNEEVATNTTNLAFILGYKKQLAKYFEDCPSVSSKALNGEYAESPEMRIAAAVDYSNCK